MTGIISLLKFHWCMLVPITENLRHFPLFSWNTSTVAQARHVRDAERPEQTDPVEL